ncbi:hypothetical protein ACJX0J_033590 [Zea mays]
MKKEVHSNEDLGLFKKTYCEMHSFRVDHIFYLVVALIVALAVLAMTLVVALAVNILLVVSVVAVICVFIQAFLILSEAQTPPPQETGGGIDVQQHESTTTEVIVTQEGILGALGFQ